MTTLCQCTHHAAVVVLVVHNEREERGLPSRPPLLLVAILMFMTIAHTIVGEDHDRIARHVIEHLVERVGLVDVQCAKYKGSKYDMVTIGTRV